MGIDVPAFVLAAIHRAAGRQLLEACKALPIVHPPSVRCPTGEAKITEYGHHSPKWQQTPCVLRYSRACILDLIHCDANWAQHTDGDGDRYVDMPDTFLLQGVCSASAAGDSYCGPHLSPVQQAGSSVPPCQCTQVRLLH